MKKKNVMIISGIILIIGIVAFLVSPNVINWLFSSQYNDNGVSHFLVVTIDENQPKEYVGELDGHRIYVEKFNLDETNFRNVYAEVLKYDNYEITCAYDDCIIRPLSK